MKWTVNLLLAAALAFMKAMIVAMYSLAEGPPLFSLLLNQKVKGSSTLG